MEPSSGDEPEINMDHELAMYQWDALMEELAEEHYTKLAEASPDLAEWAQEQAVGFTDELASDMTGEDASLEPIVRDGLIEKGFKRLLLQFAFKREDDEEPTGLSGKALALLFFDVLKERQGDFQAAAHELSVLALSMSVYENEGAPVLQHVPDMRLGFLYALVKERGSATGAIGPKDEVQG